MKFKLLPKSKSEYWLTRFVFLRLLGLIYFVAFLSLAHQVIPLLGSNGLTPAENFLDLSRWNVDNRFEAFVNLPTIFWFHISDNFLLILAFSIAS